MIVDGFVGPSGTGKSSIALSVCHRLNINDFIDDGLYIHNGVKVAGTSAKYEHNKISAVRRAIFDDPIHLEDVLKSIHYYKPQKLLILGTSKKMILRIAIALNVPQPSNFYNIEEFSSPVSIQKALFTRKIHGQHVIPIPHIQVQNDRFHQLIEKVKSIFDGESKPLGENTIVHPKFHGGRIQITNSCLKKIILHTVKPNKDVHSISSINAPIDLYEPITVQISLYNNRPIPEACHEIQTDIINIFKQMLNISIPTPHIHVVHLEIV
jgi:uncharacterized alkaline shock family protein YloU/adenylate kinase family enzyme